MLFEGLGFTGSIGLGGLGLIGLEKNALLVTWNLNSIMGLSGRPTYKWADNPTAPLK